MLDKNYNALAMRKANVWIHESIQQELSWAIFTLRVSKLWSYNKTKQVFTYLPYKNVIVLRGIAIHPVSKIPSLAGFNVSHGWIKDVWLEEAWEFSKEDYNMIRQTIRGGDYTLIITGNPYFRSMWCVRRAIELFHPELETLKQKGEMFKYLPQKTTQDGKVEQLESIVQWSNFQINNKLSKADITERWEEEATNPKDFITTGYGYFGSPTGTILGDLTHLIKQRDLDYFVNRCIEYSGGVDVGLENDATTAILGGITPQAEIIVAEGYYHSNGDQEANQWSNRGMWKKKDPHELASDVIDYFIHYRLVWQRRHPTDFVVSVDSADTAFIAILNADCRNRGIKGLRFKATKGVKYDKQKIERRIIFERQTISRGLMNFLTRKDKDGNIVSYPTRLHFEMDNIPYKRVLATGEVRLERDGTKTHPDMTNAWEYMFRRWMKKVLDNIK